MGSSHIVHGIWNMLYLRIRARYLLHDDIVSCPALHVHDIHHCVQFKVKHIMASSNHDTLKSLILAFFWIFLMIITGTILSMMFGPIGMLFMPAVLVVILVVTIIIES